MKKIITVLLIAAMLLGLTGCGHKETSEDKLNKAIKDFNEEVFNNSEDDSKDSDATETSDDSEDADASDDSEDADASDDSEDSEGLFGVDTSDASEASENEDSEEADIDNSSEESANATNSLLGDYMVFDSAAQLLETFSELGYEYINKNPGEEQTSWSFEYKYLGKETIDGVETEHYQMTMVEDGETTVSEAWYDNTWSAVKYRDDSGEQTGINASFAGSNLTMMTQLYCTQIALNLSVYSYEGVLDELAYELKNTGSDNMDFGYGTTEVELQDIKYLYGDLIMHTGAAKLNDKKIYVILETETADGALAGLHITKAIPR